MKVSEKQKQSIVNIIFGMQHGEVQWMKDYNPEEREYIIHLMENQTGALGFTIEANGTASKPETITKFRRLNNFIPAKVYKGKSVSQDEFIGVKMAERTISF